jgi:hypothetical protein
MSEEAAEYKTRPPKSMNKRLSDCVSDRIVDSLGWVGPALIVIGLVGFLISLAAHLWK